MNAVVCSSLRNDLEQQSQTCLIMRARGCMYGSPTELSPLLALAHPQLPCPHFSQSPPFPALLYLEDFWMDGLVHEIRDRGGADGAKPYCVLQESLQQQSLAQSMLSYAASSCCTIVPKCEKLHFTTKIYYKKWETMSVTKWFRAIHRPEDLPIWVVFDHLQCRAADQEISSSLECL